MRKKVSIGVTIVVFAAFSLTLCRPPTPTVAKVEVPSYATATADDTTVKEILAAPSIEPSRPSRLETWTAS